MKIRAFLLFAMVVLPSAARAQRTHILDAKLDSLFPANPSNYLTDVARIVKNPDAVNARLKEIREKDSLSLVVVTLPTIGAYDIADVAREIGRKWLVATRNDTIGVAIRNTGGVILLVPSIRKCRVEVASGSESYMTDSRAGDACRAAAANFKNDDFGTGFITIANQFASYHRASMVTVDAKPKPAKQATRSKPFPWKQALSALFLLGITLVLIIRRFITKRAVERQLEIEREKVREAILSEERQRTEIRRRKELEAERKRWNSLTPAQQASELAIKEQQAQKAKQQAKIDAAKQRKREAEYDMFRRKQEEDEEDEERVNYRSSGSNSTSETSTSTPDSSPSIGGSDSFNGGGGTSGY